MELSTLLIVIIVIIYLTKNEKGKRFVDHCGNTAVNLAASADDASKALHRQCQELLLSDEEAEEKSKAVKAKLAAAAKAKVVEDNYDDAE